MLYDSLSYFSPSASQRTYERNDKYTLTFYTTTANIVPTITATSMCNLINLKCALLITLAVANPAATACERGPCPVPPL